MKTQADRQCRADAACRHSNCNFARNKGKLLLAAREGLEYCLYVRAIGGGAVCTVLNVVDSSLL